jgi:hypothetical protein
MSFQIAYIVVAKQRLLSRGSKRHRPLNSEALKPLPLTSPQGA